MTDEAGAAHPMAGAAGTPLPPQPNKAAPLYQKRIKIYPKRVSGLFRNVKWVVMLITLGIYYITPWLRWDRGPSAPDQAVLLDLPNRRFYIFFIEIWPQEIYYLTGLLILSALALFLVTSLFGRVWCGYACPQTVWTDLFIWVERLVQGDRNKRMRLDKAPWRLEKIAKKSITHGIWLVISVATGGAWVFYFADAPTLLSDLLQGDAPMAAYIAIAALSFTTYSLGGLMREQVCTYMCPWPRIQGAMFDADTYLVSYKADRGEPRGPHKQGESWEGRGDCIDCKACVTVCPVGIDIRDGPQLECIQCALCVDACNEIMDRVDRPRGLIDYETLAMPQARAEGRETRPKLLRGRTIIYGLSILLTMAIMAYGLLTRSDLDLSVQQDRNPLYVLLSDGGVRNGYQLKIINKAHEERNFIIAIKGLDGYELSRPNHQGPVDVVSVGPDAQKTIRLYVALPKEGLNASRFRDGEAQIRIMLRQEDDQASGDLGDSARPVLASQNIGFRTPPQR
ncbi:cytochrome c oxidase accessory protein CcoG [Iodidimonas nitroreducens]|uniref:cytochrome c oxidase accessory protein CcoG n=1 Tax=Iodidimonas nitroreducens TaxID=1236968 RepID=UPI000A4AF52B|nr:cytochrome c oxidase accessory protein CcoG [Iodidimonas nitroreducens]